MFDSHAFILRRDFSSTLVPRRALTPSSRRKKRERIRSHFDILDAHAGHAVTCDCECCVSTREDTPVKSTNRAIQGYSIGSRSRLAIKNAANSLFFRSQNKQYLRFITFTFPPLPKAFATKVEEDKYLHNLFKKFLDNERKNYGLVEWLWTNERQSGDRLASHEKLAREVLHYHCIFEYKDRINYYLVNLRFLRLLLRHNFDILSSYSKAVAKSSLQYPGLKKTCIALKGGDYKYLIEDTERMYLRDELGIKRFVFLSPVDFERIRYSSLDIGRVSAYISKYISKSSDKVYCRRWGSSQGLVLKKEQLEEFAKDICGTEVVDEDTGEIMTVIDKTRFFNFMICGDKSAELIKFRVPAFDQDNEDFYFIPPAWHKWRKYSILYNKFKEYFGYEI